MVFILCKIEKKNEKEIYFFICLTNEIFFFSIINKGKLRVVGDGVGEGRKKKSVDVEKKKNIRTRRRRCGMEEDEDEDEE